MSIELTDSETAVLIDSLVLTRDRLAGEGFGTTNINSALAKINSLMTPATYGLRIEGISHG